MKLPASCLLVLLLAILSISAGCLTGFDGRTTSSDRDLADFALAKADLPFIVMSIQNESLTATPDHLIEGHRNAIRKYTATYLDGPALSPTTVTVRQQIYQLEPGTTQASLNDSWNGIRSMKDPNFTIIIRDYPDVGDQSFSFELRYNKGTVRENPVTGIIFMKADIMEIIEMRASEVDGKTIETIGKNAAAKIPGPNVRPLNAATPVPSSDGYAGKAVWFVASSTTRIKTVRIDIDAGDLKAPIDPRAITFWLFIPADKYDVMTKPDDPGVRITWRKHVGEQNTLFDPGEQITAEIDLDAVGFPLEAKSVNKGMGISVTGPSSLHAPGYDCAKIPAFLEPGKTYVCY